VTQTEMALLVEALKRRDRASLARRVGLICKFLPASWLSLRYENFVKPAKIVATAPDLS
jgi:hypothetical protein